jgi:phosphatidate phosphatase APP1
MLPMGAARGARAGSVAKYAAGLCHAKLGDGWHEQECPEVEDVGLPGMRLPDVDMTRLVAQADGAVNQALVGIKRRRSSLRPTTILPYRGWYADGVVHMRARCVERPLARTGSGPLSAGSTFKSNLRRFTILTMPDVAVTASMGEASVVVRSDRDGYLEITLPVGELAAGWHVMDLDASVPGGLAHATGRVLVPDPKSQFAVVSDIDDTVIKTGLTQGLTAAGRTLFRDVAARKPVPGMSTLYQGLQQGVRRGGSNPFFYVSAGSWNYYEYLAEYLNLHSFPRGPMFLTDWGPQADRLVRDAREHKRETITGLLQAYPELPFVLIGDVGQGDPETYEGIARAFPGRIKAILLIYVGSHLAQRSDEVAARAARLRAGNPAIPMYYAANAVEAVTHAWQLGLVRQATTAKLAAEYPAG